MMVADEQEVTAVRDALDFVPPLIIIGNELPFTPFVGSSTPVKPSSPFGNFPSYTPPGLKNYTPRNETLSEHVPGF
jgi:hypothetical protein